MCDEGVDRSLVTIKVDEYRRWLDWIFPRMDQSFARVPVYDLVFACLSPRLLVRALSCRAAYLAVAEFRIRAFNTNRHFSRYVTDPIAFRSLHAGTNTLVLISNALQFLDRTFFVPKPTSIFTPIPAIRSRFPRQVIDWKVVTNIKSSLTVRRVFAQGITCHGYPTTNRRRLDLCQERLTVQIIDAQSSPSF